MRFVSEIAVCLGTVSSGTLRYVLAVAASPVGARRCDVSCVTAQRCIVSYGSHGRLQSVVLSRVVARSGSRGMAWSCLFSRGAVRSGSQGVSC